MKFRKTKLARVSVIVIMALVAALFFQLFHKGSPVKKNDYLQIYASRLLVGDSLNCTILIDNNLNTGNPSMKFIQDWVRDFSEEHRCTIDLSLEKRSARSWEELTNGITDIIITSFIDSIPAPYGDYLEISYPIEGRFVCVTRYDNDKLLTNLNYWISHFQQTGEYKRLLARLKKSESRYRMGFPLTRFSISPYDSLVRLYSSQIGWDWRLLSALMYQESKFNKGVVSKQGAIGLMQVMESTAQRMGISNVYDTEQNIKAGVKELDRLQKRYKRAGADADNVILLTLAAYNCGEGKIQHCMRVASAEGKNPLVWDDIKEIIPLMANGYSNGELSIPPFKGRESIIHVDNIMRQYDFYKRTVVE